MTPTSPKFNKAKKEETPVSAKKAVKPKAEVKAAPKAKQAPEAPKTVPQAEPERGRRREREGVVVSDKMQKTIVVEITRLVPHPLYGRVVKRKIRAVAHDEEGKAKAGDKVRIVETHPLSKTKRWNLVEVVKS